VRRLFANRLAYWEAVKNGDWMPTAQATHEATALVSRNGITEEDLRKILPFGDDVPLPNRRVLRYGTHGIHEYRGKFFPQLVKALLNLSETTRNSVVADPMSGSGTTIVEAVLADAKALALASANGEA
jgi:site-specific DNA-methyltransferase (cytosine-N4-specific)